MPLRLLISSMLVFFIVSQNSSEAASYPESIVLINLGQKTTKNQVWDGRVRVSEGSVIAIPFRTYSHSEWGIYSQRLSKSSWKLTTNFWKGGLYLILRCPPSAQVTVDNAVFSFSFSLEDLQGDKQIRLDDGNVVIRNRTGTYYYARTGAEIGLFGEGEATIEPTTAKVNTLGTWTLRYTVGKSGIPAGGGIRVALQQSRGWGIPQYTDPQGENYVTVSCSNREATLDYSPDNAESIFDWPYPKQIALIRVKDKPLHPGDTVVVVIGDTSKGSPGFRTAQTNESYADFRVETCSQLNENYFPVYRRIKDCPIVTIIPDKAVKAYLVAPSVVKPNESFTIAVRMEDMYRNVASDFEGSLDLAVDGKPVKSGVWMTRNDKGILEIPGISIEKPGLYQFTVEGGGVAGKSNPVHCVENPDYRLYWGELHCHTFYSDGFGTKQEMWTFLRDVARLDFGSVTDHDVEADSEDYSSMDNWEDTQITSAMFNNPGRFVTFPGWEWSPHRYSISGDHYLGDHNVFFMNEDPGRFYLPASDPRYNTTDKVFAALDELDEKAMVIPHVGGGLGQWDIHDDKWQYLGELSSVHGSFEGFGQLAIDTYKRKIGFIGGGDNHNGQGGGFPPSGVGGHFMQGGLAATYARELTRESLFDAFESRRVYATSGPRIFIDARIDGALMGSEIKTKANPTLTVLARGEEPIWKAEVIKNGEVVYTWLNTDIKDKNTVTILWRVWYPKENYDRINHRGGGIPRVSWNGSLAVSGTEIESCRPCSFHLLNDKITGHDATSIQWTSVSRGDYDGISMALKSTGRNVTVDFKSEQKSFVIKPADIKGTYTEMPGERNNEVIVLKGKPENSVVSFTYTDKNVTGEGYYYVRVSQIDGEQAWASPIYYSEER